jgi:hypothetical protein
MAINSAARIPWSRESGLTRPWSAFGGFLRSPSVRAAQLHLNPLQRRYLIEHVKALPLHEPVWRRERCSAERAGHELNVCDSFI